MDWSLLQHLIGKLAERIEASGYRPDVLIGLGRRGWVFARLLSDLLGVSDLITLPAEAPIDIRDISTLEMKGRRVLVVLDAEEAGDALVRVLKELRKLDASEARTAIPLLPSGSAAAPDYYISEGCGVVYPWELHRGSLRGNVPGN